MMDGARTAEQKALCVLIGLLGLRVSEALGCEFDHFDLNNMTLTVRGKGDKTRTIPVSDEVWEHLIDRVAELRRSRTERFVTYTDRGARKALTVLGEKVGLTRHVSSHDLRATFATAAYDKSLDLRAVQELLGHASSQTTEVYTGVQMLTMREAAKVL